MTTAYLKAVGYEFSTSLSELAERCRKKLKKKKTKQIEIGTNVEPLGGGSPLQHAPCANQYACARPERICFTCNQPGHLAFQCYQNRREVRRPQGAGELICANDFTHKELIYAQVNIAHRRIAACIVTGLEIPFVR